VRLAWSRGWGSRGWGKEWLGSKQHLLLVSLVWLMPLMRSRMALACLEESATLFLDAGGEALHCPR